MCTPLQQEIDFKGECVPRKQPIYKPPFALELKEWKAKLEKMLNQGYTRLGVSPCGSIGPVCEKVEWNLEVMYRL